MSKLFGFKVPTLWSSQQKTRTGWLPVYSLEFCVRISIPNKKIQTLDNISMLEKDKVIFKCAWICMWPHPGGWSTWPQARSHQGGILGCVGLGTAQAFSRCGMPHVCFWPGIFVHLFTHLLLSFLHASVSCCALIHIFVCPYCISFCSGAVTPFTVIISHFHMPLKASLLLYLFSPLSCLLTLPGWLVFKFQLLLQSGWDTNITYPKMYRFGAVLEASIVDLNYTGS